MNNVLRFGVSKLQSLRMLLQKRGKEGSALPTVFGKLENVGVKLKRSQVSMVAAAPGVGKSAFALSYVIKSNLKTLYLSPDSDMMMLSERILAAQWNIDVDQAEAFIEAEDPQALEVIAEASKHCWFDFAAGPNHTDISENIRAYATVMGEYPELIILDNLKDVQNDGTEYDRFNETIDFLHQTARATLAHIMVLHHVVGAYEDGSTPVPLTGLVQKPGKSVRLVLTLHKVQPGILGVRVVKSNNSRASGDASYGVDIAFLPERQLLAA